MKYSELISFSPIEDIIQLTTADDKNKAREYVKSYVMSDKKLLLKRIIKKAARFTLTLD